MISIRIEVEKEVILKKAKLHFDIGKAKTISHDYDVEELFIREVNSMLDDDYFEYMYLVMGSGLFHSKGNYPRLWMNWYANETCWIDIIILKDNVLFEKIEDMFEKYYTMAMDNFHCMAIEDNEDGKEEIIERKSLTLPRINGTLNYRK